MLHHEKLDVYKCSVTFVATALEIAGMLPRGQGPLADQFRRATMSIPLNIAEGSGKVTAADRKRFYAIGRGSAMECAAILDIVRVLECCPEHDIRAAKELLERIVAMLSKLTP